MLPFELLFCHIKNCNLTVSQSKAVKSNVLETPFYSFDKFDKNRMKSNLSEEEQNSSQNLRKQNHLVIQKADKEKIVAITEKKAYIEKFK